MILQAYIRELNYALCCGPKYVTYKLPFQLYVGEGSIQEEQSVPLLLKLSQLILIRENILVSTTIVCILH